MRAPPDSVVLKVHGPKINRWEALQEMKAAPDLRALHVALLTRSFFRESGFIDLLQTEQRATTT